MQIGARTGVFGPAFIGGLPTFRFVEFHFADLSRSGETLEIWNEKAANPVVKVSRDFLEIGPDQTPPSLSPSRKSR